MDRLTPGVVQMFEKGKFPSYDPIVRIDHFKVVANREPVSYRVMLYDGTSDKNRDDQSYLFDNGTLAIGSIIKITQHQFNFVKNTTGETKAVLIILAIENLGLDPKQRAPLLKLHENTEVPKTPPKLNLKPQFSHTPGTPGSAPKICQIESLNPYQGRWTIKVRVSQKSSIRTWNRNNREGKLFSFTVVDSSGEIRVTAFNSEVDRFYDLIEVNKTYEISRGQLKPANRQFNNTNNEYEITLGSETVVNPCDETSETSNIPEMHFDFIPISKLDQKNPGDFVDLVGVAHEWTDLTSIVAKSSQKSITKREISLVDDSFTLVRLTLWGSDAENFNPHDKPVIAIKGVKVSDFNGRSLSATGLSTIMINPSNVPQAARLKGWYEYEGNSKHFETFRGGTASGPGSEFSGGTKIIPLIDFVMGTNEMETTQLQQYFVKGYISFIKRANYIYRACPSEGCNKKLIELGQGEYRCEKCNITAHKYNWRMILYFKISDATSEQGVTAFQEVAERILNVKSEELGELEEREDKTTLDKIFADATFCPWVFKIKAKKETYNDETRMRVAAADIYPIEYKTLMRNTLESISQLTDQIPSAELM